MEEMKIENRLSNKIVIDTTITIIEMREGKILEIDIDEERFIRKILLPKVTTEPKKEQEIIKKTCSICGKELPLTEEYFYRDRRHKSGFRSDCKKCCNKRSNMYHGTKVCKTCGQRKPKKQFYKKKTSKDGLDYSCKECMNSYLKERKKKKEIEDKKIERKISDGRFPLTTGHTVDRKSLKDKLLGY